MPLISTVNCHCYHLPHLQTVSRWLLYESHTVSSSDMFYMLMCRGQLSATLAQVRTHANAVGSTIGKDRIIPPKRPGYYASMAAIEGLEQSSSTSCTGDCGNPHCSGPLASTWCGTCNLDPVATDQADGDLLSGSELVFHNFREVLWYWQEYYLRRGRDRLSIEFSCHFPFRCWHQLVGKRQW
jgi:hypothetical protein